MTTFNRLLVLALLTLCAVAMLAAVAAADWTIIEEDFTGSDGAILDPDEWAFVDDHIDDNASIQSNMMRVTSAGTESAFLLHRTLFRSDQFVITMDFRTESLQGWPFYLVIVTDDIGRKPYEVRYNPSGPDWAFSHEDITGGGLVTHTTDCSALSVDVWYSVQVSFNIDTLALTVKEKSSGALVVDESYSYRVPALEPKNTVGFGTRFTTSYFDDLTVMGYGDPPNRPPKWGAIPDMHAVEDVPLVHNFTSSITDPEDPPEALRLSSGSPYVDLIEGLEVTFLFPNGVLEANITLTVFDSEFYDEVVVHFVVEPRNDPPELDYHGLFYVDEDSPTTIDLTEHVRDVDNDVSELFFIVDDPNATADGLVLTVLFTEGAGHYDLWVNLSDGMDRASVRVKLFIRPVDDAPWFDPLGKLVVLEDEPTEFNLSELVHDEDTPVKGLQITTDEPFCKVSGLVLRFIYGIGGFTRVVNVTAVSSPGKNATATLLVEVVEVNDAPSITSLKHEGPEDSPFAVDLSLGVRDEETPTEDLTFTFEHPNLVSMEGTVVTLLFTRPFTLQLVHFNVSDGELTTEGSFRLTVEPVNDAPTITRIGDSGPPFVIEVEEGTDANYQIFVEDEDDTEFTYEHSSAWEGVRIFTNGTMRISPMVDERGNFTFTVSALDGSGAKASVAVTVVVLDVNMPPEVPVIVQPAEGEEHEEGTPLTFKVTCSDHDLPAGAVLTVTWSSNVSGAIGTAKGIGTLTLEDVTLPPGTHNITVTVSDGSLTSVAHVTLTITPKLEPEPSEPDEGDEEGFLPGATCLIALAALATASFAAHRRGGRGPRDG